MQDSPNDLEIDVSSPQRGGRALCLRASTVLRGMPLSGSGEGMRLNLVPFQQRSWDFQRLPTSLLPVTNVIEVC